MKDRFITLTSGWIPAFVLALLVVVLIGSRPGTVPSAEAAPARDGVVISLIAERWTTYRELQKSGGRNADGDAPSQGHFE